MRRDGSEQHAVPAEALIFACDGDGGGHALVRRDAKREFAAAAVDGELCRMIDRTGADETHERIGVGDGLAVDFGDNVAFLQASRRGGIGFDGVDADADGLVDAGVVAFALRWRWQPSRRRSRR